MIIIRDQKIAKMLQPEALLGYLLMNFRLFATTACCDYCEMLYDESDTQVGMHLVFIFEQKRFGNEDRVIMA